MNILVFWYNISFIDPPLGVYNTPRSGSINDKDSDLHVELLEYKSDTCELPMLASPLTLLERDKDVSP